MRRKPQKKIRVHKISICACARYATKGTHGRNMYVCYKRESCFEIFARFLCHNLCLRGKCIFRSQRFSKWSTICAKSSPTKKLFRATLTFRVRSVVPIRGVLNQKLFGSNQSTMSKYYPITTRLRKLFTTRQSPRVSAVRAKCLQTANFLFMAYGTRDFSSTFN